MNIQDLNDVYENVFAKILLQEKELQFLEAKVA